MSLTNRTSDELDRLDKVNKLVLAFYQDTANWFQTDQAYRTALADKEKDECCLKNSWRIFLKNNIQPIMNDTAEKHSLLETPAFFCSMPYINLITNNVESNWKLLQKSLEHRSAVYVFLNGLLNFMTGAYKLPIRDLLDKSNMDAVKSMEDIILKFKDLPLQERRERFDMIKNMKGFLDVELMALMAAATDKDGRVRDITSKLSGK